MEDPTDELFEMIAKWKQSIH